MENEEIMILEDEDGNELEYIILDRIEIKKHTYLVLQANGRKTILILEEIDEDLEGVDEKTAYSVFELFKNRNQDRFDFK